MELKLVDCGPEYWNFVRVLRQDERVAEGFIETTPIEYQQQQIYMQKYNKNYRIALVDGEPAGYVGVIDDDIRICVHPAFQKRGVGKFMINECMKIWPSAFAKVKIDNEASLKLFKSCGFTEKYLILTKDD